MFYLKLFSFFAKNIFLIRIQLFYSMFLHTFFLKKELFEKEENEVSGSKRSY